MPEKWEGTYFYYLKDYASKIIAALPKNRFRVVFCPFAESDDLHVQQLRAAGFEVKCGGRTPANSDEAFNSLCDAFEPYDLIFLCSPMRVGVVFGIVRELVRRGVPFVDYMNFDGLLISTDRYEFFRRHYSDLSMVLPSGYTQTVARYWKTWNLTKAYNQYYLTSGVFDERFVFLK